MQLVLRCLANAQGDLCLYEAWRAARALRVLRAMARDDWLPRLLRGTGVTSSSSSRLKVLAAFTVVACGRRDVLRAALGAAAAAAAVELPPWLEACRTLRALFDAVPNGATYAKVNAAARLALAADERGPFTCQYIMMRLTPQQQQPRRRFVTLPDAETYLAFLVRWRELQQLQSSSYLCECGTHDGTLRKWVLDLDAGDALLREHQLPRTPEELFPLVLGLAEAMAEHMHATLRCCASPPPFAITSRHTPGQKCSWHVTLCALGTLAQWREIMRLMPTTSTTTTDARWRMAACIDPAVLRNSRGQFMQVCGSGKPTAAAAAAATAFFVFEGLWANASTPLMLRRAAPGRWGYALQHVATSLVLHDPWSVALRATSISIMMIPPTPKKRAAGTTTATTTTTTTTATPSAWEAPWMREFLQLGRGANRLTRIPSMDHREYWPEPANEPENRVWLHAHVTMAGACPRFLLARNEVHPHKNTCVVFGLQDAASGRQRMLMMCFSAKCNQLALPGCRHRYVSRRWVEVLPEDLVRAQALAGLLLPRAMAVVGGGGGGVVPSWLVERVQRQMGVVLLLMQPHNNKQEKEENRRHNDDDTTNVPPCLQDALALGHVRVLHHAPYVFGLHQHAHRQLHQRLLLVAQSSPRCAGTSYRAFAFCTGCSCTLREDRSLWFEVAAL